MGDWQQHARLERGEEGGELESKRLLHIFLASFSLPIGCSLKGDPSLQNALDVGRVCLSHVPHYGSREVKVVRPWTRNHVLDRLRIDQRKSLPNSTPL